MIFFGRLRRPLGTIPPTDGDRINDRNLRKSVGKMWKSHDFAGKRTRNGLVWIRTLAQRSPNTFSLRKNDWEPILVLKRTKKHRKPWKSFKFPFTWAKGWTIAKSIHFVRSNLATLRPVRGVPRKILSIGHSNTSYNLVWKRKNMISEWFEHFSNLHPESLFPSQFQCFF